MTFFFHFDVFLADEALSDNTILLILILLFIEIALLL